MHRVRTLSIFSPHHGGKNCFPSHFPPILPFSRHPFPPEHAQTHHLDPLPYATSFLWWTERQLWKADTPFSFMCVSKYRMAFVQVNEQTKRLLSTLIWSQLCPPKDLHFSWISDQSVETTFSASLTWEKMSTAMFDVLCVGVLLLKESQLFSFFFFSPREWIQQGNSQMKRTTLRTSWWELLTARESKIRQNGLLCILASGEKKTSQSNVIIWIEPPWKSRPLSLF